MLEDTLFRRLEEMRKKPPGELFELLERTLDVLRATKEALLEQRREIRSLATAVDSLRSRVDQLVQSRSAPVASEPPRLPEPEPEPETEPEPELPPAAEAPIEPEPVSEPEPVLEAERVFEAEPVYDPLLYEPLPTYEPEPQPVASGYEGPVYEPAPVDVAGPLYDAEPEPEPEPQQGVGHVLMLSTPAGYRLLIGDGAEPEPGLEIDGVVYDISHRINSPLPGDERPAYVATPTGQTDAEYQELV